TIGHSAGGHLAIWTAFEARRRALPGVGRISAAVGLAPVVDLVAAHQEDLGKSAAAAFLGGSPAEHPDRSRAASPRAMLPGGVRHAIIHGTADDYVPLAASRAYTSAARTAGDDITLLEVTGGGHMDHLDPASPAHAALVRWLEGK
ncbi:MAG TPA: prolyl oligopeptidase family serine peptidase, partial [Gemmatimonadales bacterium]|nr:prolyl oligopeptidase family serine peptidase [Gemmatimonadales bacterium]